MVKLIIRNCQEKCRLYLRLYLGISFCISLLLSDAVAFWLGYKGGTNDRGQSIDSRLTIFNDDHCRLAWRAHRKKIRQYSWEHSSIDFVSLFRLRDLSPLREFLGNRLWFCLRLIMLTVASLLQSGTRFLFCRWGRLLAVALNTVISRVFFRWMWYFRWSAINSDAARGKFRRNEEERKEVKHQGTLTDFA